MKGLLPHNDVLESLAKPSKQGEKIDTRDWIDKFVMPPLNLAKRFIGGFFGLVLASIMLTWWIFVIAMPVVLVLHFI